MTLPVAIGCTPCCWGVDDVSNPRLPPWQRVLDEAAEAGFGALGLVPHGSMPLDVGTVGAALDARGVRIVTGTVFDDLVGAAKLETLLRQPDEICAFVTVLPRPATHPGRRCPTPCLTVMDRPHDERDAAAGHPDPTPRRGDARLAGMVSDIRAAAERPRDRHGVRAAIRPDAGGSVAFEDALDRIAAATPADVAGLSLDTGHPDHAGRDWGATIGRQAERTGATRFKDIDAEVLADANARRIRVVAARAEGVMGPSGRSRTDGAAMRDPLSGTGRGGHITIERERDLFIERERDNFIERERGPRNAGGTRADRAESRVILRDMGFWERST